MRKTWVVIDSGDNLVAGVLAKELLRKAATDRAPGMVVEIEIRTGQRVIDAFDSATATTDDQLLQVGSEKRRDSRFTTLRRSHVLVDQLLGDPAAIVDRLNEVASRPKCLVAVTACPTGIAHTFMAAEALQQAGSRMGIDVRVETQGSVGSRDSLTPDEIAAAEIVLIAADVEVDRARFGGKRVFVAGTKRAITNANDLITRALTEATPQARARPVGDHRTMTRTAPYKHLMTGVAFMLPFVVAGGLLIALAYAIGGIYAGNVKGTLANALFVIGTSGAFTLIVPVLGAYIAYSIADRPGIAPGMIGGILAANLGAGFLGGIAAGMIAGYGTGFLSRLIRLPQNLEGLRPVLILPFLSTLLTGLLIIYIVGRPAAAILAFLTEWLLGMQGSSAILLGALLGAMMAFDMGGPVNKAAYAFAVGLIASHVYTPMAAAMAAGMTPPLAVALATRLFPTRFTADERDLGSAAFVLGLAFVSEGAIPFAARDPFRVIPPLMVSAALAGAISMMLGAELKVPHGGVFVLPIPNAVTHLVGYVGAIAGGTLFGAILLGLSKRTMNLTRD